MALRSPSLFLYGFQITPNNAYISFGTSIGEDPPNSRTAQLNVGYYSLSGLGIEIVRAFTAADPLNKYAFSVDRTVMGGLQNRVTLSTTNTYLSIFFSTGNPSNPASLIGFNQSDYTGATSYLGSSTCGTVLVPTQLGYNYLPPEVMRKNFGVVNVSTSGQKEAVVYNLQRFFQVLFKYISENDLASQWTPLVDWMIQQRELEFTPQISSPNLFYSATLEGPGGGLEINFQEMLPDFPFEYQTPLMKFRVRNTT